MIDYDKICRDAVKRYGIQNQIGQANEEMGELISATNRFRRGRCTTDDVITEIADVAITTYQLALIFGVDKVHAEIKRKLERLEKRMEK